MSEARRQWIAGTFPVPLLALALLDIDAFLVYLVYWTAYATLYLGLTAAVFRRTSADDMAVVALGYRAPARFWRRVMTGHDRPRSWVGFISLLSIMAAAVVLPQREALLPSAPGVVIALVAATVTVSWILLHVVFTQHYAVVYTDSGEGARLMVFGDGTRPPDYWDFAYFAFMIGMTFGTTDVTVNDPQVRRTVLGHALLSFAYNTVVIGLIVSFLVSMSS